MCLESWVVTIFFRYWLGPLSLCAVLTAPGMGRLARAQEETPTPKMEKKGGKAKQKAKAKSASEAKSEDAPPPSAVTPPAGAPPAAAVTSGKPTAGKSVAPPEDDEPPTTVVTPSQDTAESTEEGPKVSLDANRCTQCQIQHEAYQKLKAEEADAGDNVRRNQELQAKLKPDENKSAWIKVESNLRMWDIKLQSLHKNISALDAQLKQECGTCLSPSPTPSPATDGKAPK